MRILLLEDEAIVSDAFIDYINGLYPGHRIDWCTNLINFHERLYDEPGMEAYDRVFIDLNLAVPPEIPIKVYVDFLKKNGVEQFARIGGLPGEIDVPEVAGWDYFRDVVMKKSETANYLSRFALRSAFLPGLKDVIDKKIGDKDVTLLLKSDPEFDVKLNVFLKKEA